MNKKFRKIDGSHSNISMALESARHGPQVISFFGNRAALFIESQFLDLTPENLADLQQQMREIQLTEGVNVTIAETPHGPPPAMPATASTSPWPHDARRGMGAAESF